jgi:L-methionine (R)-S-oxide reductase
MQTIEIDADLEKSAHYRELKRQLTALFGAERDALANSANMAAALYHSLPNLNWVGFYFIKGDELVLGPFQGKVACVRITLGRGVCGTAAQLRETVIVADVHAFPGHVACDAESRSEIVVPLIHRGQLLGVLDLDSPTMARFDQEDGAGLRAIVTLLVQSSDFTRLIDALPAAPRITDRPS